MKRLLSWRSSRPSSLPVHAVALLLLSSCSSSVATPDPPTTEAAKVDVPTKASVDQGRSVRLALKLTGAVPADVKLRASTGLTATLDGSEIVVSAGYSAPAQGTLAIDSKEAHADVAIEVRALDWKASVTWKANEGPVAREHGSFFEDDAKRVVYMLHGSGYAPYGEPVPGGFVYDVGWEQLHRDGGFSAKCWGSVVESG